MTTLGKYQLLERIGQGGMGSVYRAHDPVIGRDVAIKIIREQILDVPEIKTRFYREAKSAGRLSHENIMVIFDVGEEDGQPFIVMEYLPGTDLRQMMDDGIDLSVGEKLRIALQICEALKYAHDHDVVHRDIKPENIRILPGRRVKILDFGIARLGNETITITRASIGTPKYMSPEQVKGDPVDHRSDVFSFGVLLYELLSGINPFSGSNISSISYKIVHEEPEPIPVGEGRMAEDLRTVVMTCLAKDREERYQNFGEVIRDLKRSMKHGTIPTRTSDANESRTRSYRWIWPAAATLVIATVLGWVLLAGGEDSSTDLTEVPPTGSTDQDVTGGLLSSNAARTAREAMVESKRRADETSPNIGSDDSYIRAISLSESGENALALETPDGVQEAVDLFTRAAVLFEESIQSFHESTAERARRQTDNERTRLVAETPRLVEDVTFRRGDARRDEASSLMRNESYEEATQAYAEATEFYRSARRSFVPGSDSGLDGTMRRAAEASQSNYESLERSVSSARGSGAFTSLFQEADAHIGRAEAAMSNGDYRQAQEHYEAAEAVLRSISTRIESARNDALDAAVRADSARMSMETAKASVHSSMRQSNPYVQARSAENDGLDAYSDARFQDAERHFSRAAGLFEEAAQSREPEPAISIEEEAIAAMASIASMTERLFASEDAAGLESIASYFSVSEWSNFFDVAHDVVASVEPSAPVIQDEVATFDVAVRLTFLNNRDNRMQNTLHQRWVIARTDSQWSVVDVESAN